MRRTGFLSIYFHSHCIFVAASFWATGPLSMRPVWWFRNSLHSRRESAEGISEPKPHWLHMLASVPLIPKFASELAAMACKLRDRDTRGRSVAHTTGERPPSTLVAVPVM